MRLFTEINAALFLATAGMLYFIVTRNIHVVIESRRRPAVKTPRAAAKRASELESTTPMRADLESALVNLGATKEEARERADAALSQGSGDFDALILRAMQHGEPRRRARRNPPRD